MQHLLLAIAMILLTIIARHTIDQQPAVVKVEDKMPKETDITTFDDIFSVPYCIYDMTVN
jgi:hypothetical protein